jgi:hypothetical protein
MGSSGRFKPARCRVSVHCWPFHEVPYDLFPFIADLTGGLFTADCE